MFNLYSLFEIVLVLLSLAVLVVVGERVALGFFILTIPLWSSGNEHKTNTHSTIPADDAPHPARKHRPRPSLLDLTVIRTTASRLNAIACQSPIFQTPAAGHTFYEDRSITHRLKHAPSPTATPISVRQEQLAAMSLSLESQLGPLPAGWILRLSSDKRVFFVHLPTGATSWKDPRLASLDAEHQGKDEAECLASPPPRSLPMHERVRINTWIEDEYRRVRARDARIDTLRGRARMARLQRRIQPLNLIQILA